MNLIDNVWSLNYSPDGTTLVSGGEDSTVKIWDVATGQELQTLSGHIEDILSVSYSPDGATLASASWDNTVKIWGNDYMARGNTTSDFTLQIGANNSTDDRMTFGIDSVTTDSLLLADTDVDS